MVVMKSEEPQQEPQWQRVAWYISFYLEHIHTHCKDCGEWHIRSTKYYHLELNVV